MRVSYSIIPENGGPPIGCKTLKEYMAALDGLTNKTKAVKPTKKKATAKATKKKPTHPPPTI